MNDRNITKYRATEWSDRRTAELRYEDRRVLAVLLLYGALIVFVIWGTKVLERDHDPQPEPVSVGGAA
jgi:hypothetical protein